MAGYGIHIEWRPRDLLGRFQSFTISPEDLDTMTMIQTAIAEVAAEKAPNRTGALASEMFIGGGGESFVTPRVAQVKPGDPYGPSQDTGFVGPAALHGGKYYSVAEWCDMVGIPEDEAYAVARSLNYSGTQYMAAAEAASKGIVFENVGKMVHNVIIRTMEG